MFHKWGSHSLIEACTAQHEVVPLESPSRSRGAVAGGQLVELQVVAGRRDELEALGVGAGVGEAGAVTAALVPRPELAVADEQEAHVHAVGRRADLGSVLALSRCMAR